MKTFFFTVFFLIIMAVSFIEGEKFPADQSKPTIALSFDDGDTNDIAGYKLAEWNRMILDQLEKEHLKVILFSAGKNKTSSKGKYVLSSWNDAGHLIANHTYSHLNYNSDKVTTEAFEADFLKNDSIIKVYSNYIRYFRFPYLKEGNTAQKVNDFRKFLLEQNYRNGHVTVDASDWYISSRLSKRLKEDPNSDITGFRNFYLNHLLDHANFYDSVAYQLEGRHVKHVLLLHHNLAAALFLDDLIKYFRKNGWDVINTDEAYKDEIYMKVPATIPAGESLIWSLAKQSGKFDKILRYPAEDSEYEVEKMDKAGL